MSERILSEIEASITELDLADQVRLLQYLAPRIAGAVLKTQQESRRDIQAGPSGEDPWRRFQALGNRLAATSVAGAPSLTDAVSQMRR
jgi:hypothetical protein